MEDDKNTKWNYKKVFYFFNLLPRTKDANTETKIPDDNLTSLAPSTLASSSGEKKSRKFKVVTMEADYFRCIKVEMSEVAELPKKVSE